MYAKIFSSLFDGSMRGQPDLILVFVNMLTRCDIEGFVDRTPRAIADETGIPIDRVKEAINSLESPDPESRTPEMQGRRIVRISEDRTWGWKIVNFLKYRGIRDDETRREQNREAQKRYKLSQGKPQSATVSRDKPESAKVSQGKPQKAHTEAEAEADADTEAEVRKKNTSCVDKPPRARNPIMDALGKLDCNDLSQLTASAWGRVAKAKKEIVDVCPNVTPEEINRRAGNYKLKMAGAMLTSTALSANWAKCDCVAEVTLRPGDTPLFYGNPDPYV